MKLAVPVFVAGLLSGCGYVGPPQPPTLDIPATIADFRAGEYGENIDQLPPILVEIANQLDG